MRFISLLLSLVVMSGAASADLSELWTVEGFKMPESVVYDTKRDRFYVSNVNMGVMEQDNNGSIGYIAADGSHSVVDWVSGLSSPKGIDLYNNYLYVADVKELVVIDVDKEKIAARYLAPESGILNGLTVSGADWTGVTAIFQQCLYSTLFSDENIDEWMKGFVADLKDGKFNEELVYSKKLVKRVEEYTGNIPPDVKAAKLLEKPGRIIRYIMTTRGPVPAEMNPNDIDYQHYIDKQLGPVADVYLELKGQKFENLFKAQQLSLFDF